MLFLLVVAVLLHCWQLSPPPQPHFQQSKNASPLIKLCLILRHCYISILLHTDCEIQVAVDIAVVLALLPMSYILMRDQLDHVMAKVITQKLKVVIKVITIT